MEKLLSLPQVAELTGLAPRRLRRWLKEGKGPAYLKAPTGPYLFRLSEIERWLKSLQSGEDDEI